jgi:uncharacterized protein (TIGR03492 family)
MYTLFHVIRMSRAVKILLISNGHGEDAIGAKLAAEFRALEPSWILEALPIVGRGDAYERAGVRVIGPRWVMPSGGFTFTSLKLLLADWQAGMYAQTHAMHWAARDSRADVVIVVGDVYALWVTFAFAAKDVKPTVFQVQPLVSRYYQDGMTAQDRLERASRVTVDSFTPPERFFMRRVERVFTRDERSAAWLRELGVKQAEFEGNVMMDLLSPELELALALDGRRVLALLPGTRDDYLFSLPVMLKTAALLPEVQAFAAFPGETSRIALPAGWSWVAPTPLEAQVSADLTARHESGARVPVLRAAFAALLHASSVALGTAGTANEQAVGLGVPVIGFPTRGPQFTLGFAKAQARLLGAGLRLDLTVNPQQLASSVREALSNPDWRAATRAAGMERMGVPGGARRIAAAILETLRLQKSEPITQE